MGNAGGALVGHICKFKYMELTSGEGQRAWMTLMVEEILPTAMGKLIYLGLWDGEDPDI